MNLERIEIPHGVYPEQDSKIPLPNDFGLGMTCKGFGMTVKRFRNVILKEPFGTVTLSVAKGLTFNASG